MTKTGILTLMVLFLSLHEAKGKPLSGREAIVNSELIRNSRSFGLRLHGEPHSHRCCSIPFPTFSFGNLFKDNTNDMAVVMSTIERMEKNQEKILNLLTELIEAPKTTSCVSPSVPTPNDHSEIEPENIVDLPSDKLNSTIIDMNSEERTREHANQHQTSDFKNEVKNDDTLIIVPNENETTPTQITNVEVVKPLEPVNSTLKLDSNENTDEKVETSLHSNFTISTQTTNEEVVKPLEPVNSTLKLDSNENTDEKVKTSLHSNTTISNNQRSYQRN